MARWDRAWMLRLERELAELPYLPMREQAEVRRALGADPVAFALIYLDGHLRDERTDEITFSEIHFEWGRRAEEWKAPPTEPAEWRHAEIAPRNTGKTTWWFLILPLWAAAHGHAHFVAAFADTTGQAEAHLATFRKELDSNALLRHDFPELCSPARRLTGTTLADRQGMLHQRSGFVFAARGVDAASLGLKVGARRPDLIIVDDVEPDEASYSAELAKKRLSTLVDAILPLNIYARVVMIGTVTMPGSIMHQLVKAAAGVEVEDWITEEGIQAHHHLPIVADDEGNERSAWPAKWPLPWLLERRHTREYAKNYANDPMARDGQYWTIDDFVYGTVPGVTRVVLAVDPAVTAKKTSDYTGLAVVGYSPSARKCEIREAFGVRATGARLRKVVLGVLERHPDIRRVLVETNQGGELWAGDEAGVFHDLPGVRVLTHTATVSKEIRFADALRHWQGRRVQHVKRLAALEEQCVAFPKGAYDDITDSAVIGVHHFFPPDWERPVRVGVRTESYV